MDSRVRRRLAEITLGLVRIPSVTGEEREIAHHMERWALSLEHLSRDDVIRHGNNLIIGQPDGHRPCVALLGHLDTVPPHAGDPPPQMVDARVFGRGASDMKGGLAVMQALYEDLDLLNLPFNLLLLFYDREEGPYQESGLGTLLDEYDILNDIDLAIVLEPTDNALQLGCVGAVNARIRFRGRAAHAARPWEGENAIHKAAPLLQRLHQTPVREVEVHGLIFRETLSATLAHGGTARNVIPDRFELSINHRFAAPQDVRQATDTAVSTIRGLAGDAEVEIVDVAPPGPIPTDNVVLEHLQRQADLEVQPKQAWTDVGRLAMFGIDAVNFGPGATSQAHQAGEWVHIDELARAYDVMRGFLETPLEA
jgi:succinyl-diaminopimelate desuccinylase